jgi:hypothetical protein
VPSHGWPTGSTAKSGSLWKRTVRPAPSDCGPGTHFYVSVQHNASGKATILDIIGCR